MSKPGDLGLEVAGGQQRYRSSFEKLKTLLEFWGKFTWFFDFFVMYSFNNQNIVKKCCYMNDLVFMVIHIVNWRRHWIILLNNHIYLSPFPRERLFVIRDLIQDFKL